MDDDTLEEIMEICENKFSPHFIRNHVKPVLENVDYLLNYHPSADENCLKASVWLQDIIHKETGYKGNKHHVESARKASKILRELDVSSDEINCITDAIRCHRFKGVPYPEKLESKIVFSANYMANSEVKTLFGKPVEQVEEDRIKKRFLLPEAGAKYEDDRIDRLKEKYGVDD